MYMYNIIYIYWQHTYKQLREKYTRRTGTFYCVKFLFPSMKLDDEQSFKLLQYTYIQLEDYINFINFLFALGATERLRSVCSRVCKG